MQGILIDGVKKKKRKEKKSTQTYFSQLHDHISWDFYWRSEAASQQALNKAEQDLW